MDNIISFLIKLITSFIDRIIPAYFKGGQKLKKMKYLIDFQKNVSKDFHEQYIIPITQETLFFLGTEIDTNDKSINSYIALKNSLGENYTWKTIKRLMPFIKFDDKNKIYIKVTKVDRWSAYIILFLVLLLIIIMFYTLSLQSKATHLSDLLLIYILSIIPFIGSVLLLTLVSPTSDAIIIKKKLEKNNL